MTPEAQRIAIAEVFDGLPPGSYSKYNPGVFKPFERSLDAMHEAEKALPDLRLYRRFLYLVVCDDPTNEGNETTFATAAQRAEAFLRTLNLWQE